MPTAQIITTAGTNCDRELAVAFELAGARVEPVHLNALIARPSLLERADLIGLPGGFSYGDAVAAGRIAAVLMREHLYGAFVAAIERGVPIIAPCNGFQVAVQMGLLPGPAPGEPWPDRPAAPTLALAANAGGRFVDCWSRVVYTPAGRCIWTAELDVRDGAALLPVAHAEGRFVPSRADQIDELEQRGQIAVRYAPDDNPNGSAGDVAGICDASGLVFGLMPHPERFTTWTQHPWWTRLDAPGDPPGLQIFRRAVAFARQVAVS